MCVHSILLQLIAPAIEIAMMGMEVTTHKVVSNLLPLLGKLIKLIFVLPQAT